MNEQESENRYIEASRSIHAIFTASDLGKRALDSLEEIFCTSFFNNEKPSEAALYQQGQASVISEIKSMIRNIEEGRYDERN